jgi:uncharacterized protein YbbC (DUF1343 family)
VVSVFLVYGRTPHAEANDSLRVPILVYHRFGPVVADGMTVTTPVFAAQLQYLQAHAYTVIPLRQLVAYYVGAGPQPPPHCLDAPVTTYWPEFGANGKMTISIRELLTHYSGLRPDLDLQRPWSGDDSALRLIVAEKPVAPPGSRFLYSDINFAILGELVRRASGLSLDRYCTEHIFAPLGMMDTAFRPSVARASRIAPTEPRYGQMQVGIVHDPTAYRMDGIAGHAGLFSTADDLAAFAQMLLDEGSNKGVRILQPFTVERMSRPQTPLHATRLRGLGWDLGVPFVSNAMNRMLSLPYGHTGFTGTSLWIEPQSKTYVVILTNRVHPSGRGDVRALRAQVAQVMAAALEPSTNLAAEQNETRGEKIQSGLDVLAEEQFAPLAGLRVGLITNHTGRDSNGRRTIDLLRAALHVNVVALFSPEHGLYGKADDKVASGTDATTTLPVHSLYGSVLRPTDAMLNGVDALVFDMQDAGARFYTYVTTMAYAMEAAARKGIDFYVLDRPNPIDGVHVQGPVLDADLLSFTGYFSLPVRRGMTVGELAQLFNVEKKIGVKLHVILMRGYQRTEWYDDTGLPWIAPSPNLRTLEQATLYPGVAIVEGANVSVGRGTRSPFEVIGARWVLQALKSGQDPRLIVQRWQQPLENFRALRSRYLLYAEAPVY